MAALGSIQFVIHEVTRMELLHSVKPRSESETQWSEQMKHHASEVSKNTGVEGFYREDTYKRRSSEWLCLMNDGHVRSQ